MGTVTIAATYGAGGSVIGPALAKRLGLPFVDRAIPSWLVEKIYPPQVATLAEDSYPGGAAERLLTRALNYSGLFVGVTVSTEAPDVAHTEAAIQRLADEGGAVVLGRAGVFVLRERTDAFHVRLDGPVEARRRAVMALEGLDYKTATRMQQHTDEARRAYIAHFYPRSGAWEDPRNYHMVLDSTAISINTCVDIITRAAQDFFTKAGER
jgi:cytidylate kinase